MINVIGSLRVELPGSTMWSKQECFVNSEDGKLVPNYSKFDHVQITLEGTTYDKKSKKKMISKDVHLMHVRKCKPAIQTIPITEEAYEDMTGNSPEGIGLSAWKKMSKIQRFEHHAKSIANDLGGKVLDYTFFE